MPTELVPVNTDTWSQYERNGILLINYGKPGTTYSFPAETLETLPTTIREVLVYAEEIELTKSVTYPGVNIALCCNKLTVKKEVGKITLDVSGQNGRNQLPEIGGGTRQPGEINGKPSGSILLYVEDWDSDITPDDLQLKAVGGRGGAGYANAVSRGRGGNGGNGGDGGNIIVLFGNMAAKAIPLVKTILTDVTKSFSERLFILKDSLMPLLRKLKETGLDINITKLDEVVSDYAELLGSIAGLALTLAGVNEDAEKPIWRTLQGENKNMMLTLAAFVKSRHFPKKPKDLLKATQDLAAKILIYQSQVATKPREAATRLKGLYQAYTTTAASPSEIHEELDEFLRKGVVEVVHKCNQRVIESIHNMSTVDSGLRGQGGAGDANLTDNGRGAPGAIGRSGTKIVPRPLYGGAHPPGTSSHAVLANPDQCQMVLNFADLQYFKGSKEQLSLATTLYNTLYQRLAFVPALLAAKTPGGYLRPAYKRLEDAKVIIAAQTQLSQIYETVQTRLHQIELGQDFLAQSPTWAPRLSYNYFQTRIEGLCTTLGHWEEIYKEYQKTTLRSDQKLNIITPAMKVASTELKAADQRIATLIDPAGEINATAFTIQQFTPLMKAKRRDIADKMKPLTDRVKLKIKIEPSFFLNALGAVIKDHKSVDVWKQGLGLVGEFKSIYDKANIEKENIIKKLKEVDGTFESIKEGFTALSDGEIQIDDPGAGKLLIAKADFDKLLKEFKESLPVEDAEAVSKEVDEYVALVETRNNAVVRYNSLVGELFQAYKDEDYYKAQQAEYSRQLTDGTVDPDLPATDLWLRKCRDDMRQRVLQELYAGSRALKFWGLRDRDPMSFFSDIHDELPAAAKLLEAQEDLATVFEEVLTAFSGTIANSWPLNKSDRSKEMGVVIRLSESARTQFLEQPVVEDEGGRIYRIVLNIPPVLNSKNTRNPFNGRANVRIDQVRVWLPGAKVGVDDGNRHTLTVSLTHCGNETIVSADGKPHTFTHDPIRIDFRYFADKVTEIQDSGSDKVFGAQNILAGMYHGGKEDLSNNANAAIGPFATWSVEVREASNSGLDLSEVKAVFVDFWGTSMPFQSV